MALDPKPANSKNKANGGSNYQPRGRERIFDGPVDARRGPAVTRARFREGLGAGLGLDLDPSLRLLND